MPDFDQSLPLPVQPPNNDDTASSTSGNVKKTGLASTDSTDTTAALNLVRGKIATIYGKEPSALQEEQAILASGSHSKHQKFIQSLMQSGKSLVDIQTEWHAYYKGLPDADKHQVWDEFYTYYGNVSKSTQAPLQPISAIEDNSQPPIASDKLLPTITTPVMGSVSLPEKTDKKRLPTNIAETKADILEKISARGKLTPKHHLQSLLFGLSMGLVVVTILMFSFFNERLIAPFITPSRTASASPIIITPNEQVGPESKIIIPKINVDVPVVYNVTDNNEKTIQKALEDGVIHYPNTPVPGETGNVVVVGHSSNNLLNKGKYKFAFVLLNKLQVGDTITMQYNGKRYVYKVYETLIVQPTDTRVLGPTDKPASLTLITCDPPGTAHKRLIIHAEQISPNPNANVASASPAAPADATTPAIVPGAAPSLLDRLFGWL